MNKRGISAVVATIFMILLTIIAIGIIWLSTLKIVDSEFQDPNARVEVVTSEGYTFYDPVSGTICVQVTRSSSDSNLKKMRIIFTFEDGNTYSTVVEAPGVNSRKTYCFGTAIIGGTPISIKVAPVFTKGGKDVDGPITSELKNIPEGTVGLLPIEGQIPLDGGEVVCNPLMDNLVLHYDFDNAGNPYEDTSANPMDGYLDTSQVGYLGLPSWTSNGGIYGGGVRLWGDNVTIMVNQTEKYNFGTYTSFTFATWFKPEKDLVNHMILDTDAFESALLGRRGYDCRILPFMAFESSITCRLNGGFNNATEIGINTVATIDISIGQWSHIAWTVNRTGNSQLYLDGIAVGNPEDVTSLGNMTTLNPSKKLVIGRGGRNSASSTNASLDDWRLYNRTLTLSEIQKVMAGDQIPTSGCA